MKKKKIIKYVRRKSNSPPPLESSFKTIKYEINIKNRKKIYKIFEL